MTNEQINTAIAAAGGWKPALIERDMTGKRFSGHDIPPESLSRPQRDARSGESAER